MRRATINEPIPVLMYHDVEQATRERKYKHFYVLADDLFWQMNSLKKAGYTPITFEDLSNGIVGQSALPAKPVLLTFDDGYKNILKLAHPILKDLQFRYTVFVVSGKMGGSNDWVAAEGYETSPLMDWDDVRELRNSGLADIQAHTVNHKRLTDLTQEECTVELSVCKETIEDRLNKKVHTICYPWGAWSPSIVQRASAAGYRCGVTTDFGRARPGDDLLKIPRISIHYVPPFSFDYGLAGMNFWWKVRSRKDKRRTA